MMQCGSAIHHQRYMEPVEKTRNRRMCPCGCRRKVTHRGMANGVCLMSGCELFVRRWVKDHTSARRLLSAPKEKPE